MAKHVVELRVVPAVVVPGRARSKSRLKRILPVSLKLTWIKAKIFQQ
jgi:hypothetical protein